MRNIVKYLALALICGALCVPAADARGRNNAGRDKRTEKSTVHSRPGSSVTGRKNDRHDRDNKKQHNNHPQHATRPGTGHSRPQPPARP
ncbi:MAG: hypothetical protein K2L99_08640, partial [Muribaculaceae bacterium]|nr:hypothetical protein [Muribaculaceae bacterium]